MTSTEPLIRLAIPQDAPALLDLQLALDGETEFMLVQPGERRADVERLASRLAAGPSYVVVAVVDGLAAGYVDVSVLPYARARRTGHVVAGVRAAYQGQGLGKALFRAAVAEARARGMGRLELTVMEHNRRALGLYLSCGFQVEGLRRSALDVGDRRVNEYYLGLLLD
ncbi:GNAT family N-acetyltransferase [Sphaerisporangium rufum]|uniref:GNAT family N-acetyltransferase n=1 Tax=Sphaerisporangium rufum TaxID=1381558 RepID=UPI001950B180|nr:GNAT family N-acetyltransferase [Sphaerisporangium rufum]